MYARIVEGYKRLLWGTMDLIGVSKSVRWKILIAVGIQFAVSIGQLFVPFAFSDWLRVWVTVLLLGLAGIAFLNTVLIVREDIIDPIIELEEASHRVGSGHFDVQLSSTEQEDELGSLTRSFANMQEQIETAARKAEALADQDFDAPVLEQELPGRYGEALARMTDNLREYIAHIEADRNRFQLLNNLVGHDVPNVVNILYGRLDLLRHKTSDEEQLEDIDILEEQARAVEEISNTVADLTASTSIEKIEVGERLLSVVDRLQDSFPDASIDLHLPDDSIHVPGNDLLDRVFENLIVNGIEHNDAPNPNVTIRAEKSDEIVELLFSDNGPGLDTGSPEIFLESIEEGSGLEIVQTIVDSFGGVIEPVDGPTEGTTFRVELPLVAGDELTGSEFNWFEGPDALPDE